IASAGGLFAIAVVVVAINGWTVWSVHLDHFIHYGQRFHDERICGGRYAQPHKLEEPGIDDFPFIPNAATISGVDLFARIRRAFLGTAEVILAGQAHSAQESTWSRPSARRVHSRLRHTIFLPTKPPIHTRNPRTSCIGRSHQYLLVNGSWRTSRA